MVNRKSPVKAYETAKKTPNVKVSTAVKKAAKKTTKTNKKK